MTAKESFERLVVEAQADPQVVALVLYGSQASGLATVRSDYDFAVIVADAVEREWVTRLEGPDRTGLDGRAFTQAGFDAWADWNGPLRWIRYALAGAKVVFDRSGRIGSILEANADVPRVGRAAFIDARLDHFVNQIYRCAKCRRDGDALAARIEAVAAIEPLLNVLFALDDGRIRPYAKYLTRELMQRPPASLRMAPATLIAHLERILAGSDLPALQALLAAIAPVARVAGHAAVLDAWGEALDWMLTAKPEPD